MKRTLIVVMIAVGMAWCMMPSPASAQSWDDGHELKIILPSGGDDPSHTVTLVAPELNQSDTLTLPDTNESGVLVNDGKGVLSWSGVPMIISGSPSASLSNATGNQYFTPNGGGAVAQTSDVAGSSSRMIVPTSGTIKNFFVAISAAPGHAGSSRVFTLTLNGVAMSVTCTISGTTATSASNVSNSFTVAPGDQIGLHVANTKSTTLNAAGAEWGFEIYPQ